MASLPLSMASIFGHFGWEKFGGIGSVFGKASFGTYGRSSMRPTVGRRDDLQ